MRFLLPVLILGIAIAGAGWLLNQSKFPQNALESSAQIATKPARPFVRTQVVSPAYWHLPVHLSGVVAPKSQVAIISEADGRLVYKNPDIYTGELIAKGDVLFRIESPALRNQLLAAQSKVHQAQQALLQTQAQVDTAGEVPGLKTPMTYRRQLLQTQQAVLNAAQADLKLARTYYARQEVAAPFDGRIVGQNLTSGQLLSVGMELASLYNPDIMQVEIGLNSANASLLQKQHVGIQNLEILIARARGQHFDYFSGQLLTKKGTINPVTGLETLKIEVHEKEQKSVNETAFLMPGERVDVRISIPSEQILLRIPLALAANDEVLGVTLTSKFDGDLPVAKVVRTRLKRVFSDRQYGYFSVSSDQPLHIIEQPPAWLLPGHEVKVAAQNPNVNRYSIDSEELEQGS